MLLFDLINSVSSVAELLLWWSNMLPWLEVWKWLLALTRLVRMLCIPPPPPPWLPPLLVSLSPFTPEMSVFLDRIEESALTLTTMQHSN